MADEAPPEDGGAGEQLLKEPQLPLPLIAENPGTLLMTLQSPEQMVVLSSAKALYQFAKDGGDGDEPNVITLLRGALGDGGGLPVLIKLLTREAWCGADVEVQAVCLMILARCAGEAVADGRLILRMRNGEKCIADRNGEEKCRLKTVELGGLKPMVELLKSEELDVAGKAAFSCACHALDSPVRLAIKTLGGIPSLLDLMAKEDDVVVDNTALALSTLLQHVEAKDQLYNLQGMKVLIEKGIASDNVAVQENTARALAYAIEQEGNLKDFRRLDGVNKLIEMLAALPDTDRTPNDKVRQSASFALAISAFDSECRTEIRMKEGLRALSNCLASEDPRVQEEALMALANCAFDIPCKQTIGALGGMKNGIGLLSNPELSVVANACVALSRLVFDFMSGVDFIEEDGVPQLFEVLNTYVKNYEAYLDYKEKVAAGETPEGEAIELPDLRLGRAILENCKACAEQGNVREEMRKKDGFFPQMFKVIKHEDEIVSGMACQALANAAYDVEGRPMLLELDAIPEFVKCLTYKDVDTQLSAARAIGNFAMDSYGRTKVREAKAMTPLVKQLQAKDENGKDAIEPRRAAILAIGKCASDRESAVELCDIGALSDLLSLMDTHWKQLGQAAEDAVERLLQKSQPAKLWLRGEVDFEDVTTDLFFDMGVGRKYTSLKKLQEEEVNTNREVLLADMGRDEGLEKLYTALKDDCSHLKIQGYTEEKSLYGNTTSGAKVLDSREEEATEIKKECVRRIASKISDNMGGAIPYDRYQDFGYSVEVQRCKLLRRSNVIWIGDLKKGACRHRAFVFKYLCDKLLPYLCRLERAKIERGAHVGHAWNVVKFYGDNDQDGQQRSYTLDLMHSVGAMYSNGTNFEKVDEWVQKYQRKDYYVFNSLQ